MSIEIEGLHVTAGEHDLVRDVTLRVEPGTWLTVIGPNGAGKTSLVESIVGLRRPRRGSIRVGGRDVSSLSERERARLVAFVPQLPEVPVGMSVRDYVTLGRTAFHGVLRAPRTGDFVLVEEVLTRLHLDELAERELRTLSGGERQRAVVARAMAQSTMVIVLDEPTTGLDLRHQLDILELLRREVDECGLCVVATLHDLTLAGQFADRLLLLDDGRVVLEGPSADVVRSDALARCYGMGLRVVDVDGADVIVPVRR